MSWNDIRTIQTSNSAPDHVKHSLERLSRDLDGRFEESASAESMDFFLAAFKAVASLRGTANVPLRLQCVDRCGLYFHFNDRFNESLECADSLERTIGAGERAKWAWRVPALRAMNESEMGRFADAVVDYSTALDLLGDRDPNLTARMLLNLGNALNFASLHHEAIQSFKRAAQLTDAWLVVARARSNTALAYLFLGEHDRGLAVIESLLQAPPPPKEPLERLRLPVMHSIAVRLAEPWPMDKALDEIRNRRGTQFNPELTDIFLALVEKLQSEHADLDDYLGKAGRNSPFLQARHKIRLMLADPPNMGTANKAPETVH